MSFAAIHIPNFSVQAVVRAEPSLRASPLALIDGVPPVWAVVAVNELAQQAGIEIGMTRAAAEQFESVAIHPRSQAQEKAAHAALLDLAWSVSPRVEDTDPATLVIDLSGLASLFGSDENLAALLAQRITAFGLAANIAVSQNIEVAIHAARGFPGITLIATGEESQRLGPLPISVLGASSEILETLNLWGVRLCEALAALPVLQLSERLGQEGVRLHQWARGAGIRALILSDPATNFEEELELEDSVEELEPLSFLLGRLLDQLCLRLTARSLAAGSIRLRFALDPTGLKDVQIRNDNSRRKKRSATYEKTLTLPVPMRDSKVLLNLLRLALQGDPPPAPILKVFMASEPAKPRAVQTGLFLPPSPDVAKLEVTIARLANLVGAANVGSPQLIDTHRPGEFRMTCFTPPREESKKSRRKSANGGTATPGCALNTLKALKTQLSPIAFRMFRPPLPASVQIQDSRPKKVSFRGVRGEVLAASGPWRSSGDWWREDAWHQDEWDLEIRFNISPGRAQKNPACSPQHGLYRFYFDSLTQGWFVRGIYD
ncbi:MAG TPA: DNA polymerase Y family protein [Candidatus Acidoferrales bacterium]|nr:DNA polymerase Y family protein [Candidatus Acidoferrales bacterium]